MPFMPLLAALILGRSGDPFDPGANPLLMRHPTVNATDVVFQYAGDLWRVPRAGGDAIRLTASGGTTSDPYFSPDGKEIAFSGNYDGNTDVYVMPAQGGIPKRLTTHPAADIVLGWTPDGKDVLFSSTMLSNTDYARLFTVPAAGGLTKQLPFPAGAQGAFSPDGKQIALVPNGKWELAWKRYRGGQATPIWIGDISDSKITAIPRKGTNDSYPMWIGNSIYYLSDPTGPVGLNRYDTKTGKVSTVIPGYGFDLKSATAGPDVIAYERLGSIHLYNPSTGDDHTVPVHIDGDFSEARTEIKDLRSRIRSINISPTGKRAVISARGWVFTVPAEKGDARQLDDKQGCDRNDAKWSLDGKSVSYICDEGDGEHLTIYDMASGQSRSIPLGGAPADYRMHVWSPDSKSIAYTDNKLNLWVLDVASGKNTLIDTDTYWLPSNITPDWSPDSKWLAWSRNLPSYMNAIFVYSFDSGKKTQITDGLSYATQPVFDRGGKYLYFLATTNLGFGIDLEDLESMAVTNTSSNVYAILLRKNVTNPLLPESDDEKPKDDATVADKDKDKDKKDAKKDDTNEKFNIDLDGIQHRVLVLPLPKAGYQSIVAGPDGTVFALAQPPRATPTDDNGPGTVQKFSFSDRKVVSFADGVTSISASADGSKLLLGQGPIWKITGAAGPQADGKPLDLSELRARVDPLTEWRAIYHQVWRKERILFYDPHLHGIDADVMEKRYEPFLAGIRSRDDLNYLFTDMLGELCIGHMFISGGDLPSRKSVRTGLLGADFAFDKNRYRITRVYDGESWNPDLTSPLAAPGVNAVAGEYILSVDGKDLTASDDIYQALEDKAGRQVRLKIGPNADGTGSRDVVAVPVASDIPLRQKAWEEDNRRYVEKETGGLGGYVHVPDTGGGGWDAFMRYFYSQLDKTGMIIDDRFNHGGYINDFMIREMQKPLDFYGATRYGQMFRVPNATIYGPKIMLINEMAGSGGDIFPYLFREHHIGKLYGKRTWGGELIAAGFEVIDGGFVRAPDDAEFDPRTGNYVIDNVGVPPDVEVDLDPSAWRMGVDSQLKAAVDELKKEIAAHPLPPIKRPPYPDKTKLPPN